MSLDNLNSLGRIFQDSPANHDVHVPPLKIVLIYPMRLEVPTVIVTSIFVRVILQDKCCGVKYYTDWRDTVWGAHRIDVVPDSCCKNYKYQCGINFEISDINRQVSSISSHHVCSEIHRTTTIRVLKNVFFFRFFVVFLVLIPAF